MRIPKSTKVGPMIYETIRADHLSAGPNLLYGQCDSENGKIYMQKCMDKKKEELVYFHELLHGIAHTYGIDGLSEETIKILAPVLLDVLECNKMLKKDKK